MTAILVSSADGVNESDNMDLICTRLLADGFRVSHSVNTLRDRKTVTREYSDVSNAAAKFRTGEFVPDAVLATQTCLGVEGPIITKAVKDGIPLFIYKHFAVITERSENTINRDNPWPIYAKAERVFCQGAATRMYLQQVGMDTSNVQVVGSPKHSAFASNLPPAPVAGTKPVLAVLGCALRLRPEYLTALLTRVANAARWENIEVVYRPHHSAIVEGRVMDNIPQDWTVDLSLDEFALARRATGVLTLIPSTALIPYWARNLPAFYIPSCFGYPIFQSDYADILRPLSLDRLGVSMRYQPNPKITRDLLAYLIRLPGDPSQRISNYITDFFIEKEMEEC